MEIFDCAGVSTCDPQCCSGANCINTGGGGAAPLSKSQGGCFSLVSGRLPQVAGPETGVPHGLVHVSVWRTVICSHLTGPPSSLLVLLFSSLTLGLP